MKHKPARTAPTRTPDAELPLKGLFALQTRLLAITVLAPLAAWLIPWPAPLRLLTYVFPAFILIGSLVAIALLRCPACRKPLMAKGLILFPRKKCPHCREVVAG